MKIDIETLANSPTQDAADMLYEAGKALQGKNLRRASWAMIAEGLTSKRAAPILLRRLEAAVSREDALRVLRIARKQGQVRRGSKGARGKSPKESLPAIAQDTSPDAYQAYLDMLQEEEYWFQEEWASQEADFAEWLLETSSGQPEKTYGNRQLLPISPLHQPMFRYAWEHRKAQKPLPEDIRSRIDQDTYDQLRALAASATALGLSSDEVEFLHQHRLEALLRYASNPEQPVHPTAPLCDGFHLAGLAIIENRAQGRQHPFTVDWAQIAPWLLERLSREPQLDESAVVTASLYAFCKSADVEAVRRLLGHALSFHPAWLPGLLFALQRLLELLPRPFPPGTGSAAAWGETNETFYRLPWEWALDAGHGSLLLLHNLRSNQYDLFARDVQTPPAYWYSARFLLAAGAGTLRRMDYPGFTLYCRPSIYLVQLETFERMVNVMMEVVGSHNQMASLNQWELEYLLFSSFDSLSSTPLPVEIGRAIIETLKRHTIAYVLLKEVVLKEPLQKAPFRIRKKHIQHFWASVEAGELSHIAVPDDPIALRGQYSTDVLKEGMAHALLTHFKTGWGLEGEQANLLKEALINLLRCLALTYHFGNGPEWWPGWGSDLTVEDLQHAPQISSFLIQCTEQHPRELAQALMIDPHQGLPMMNGGQLSPLERSCRRIIREAAGVSQRQVVEGTTRVFTCRPLAKRTALDRGSLAGDCSSDTVPLRALSPHHMYYGLYEGEEQQRGYMTVYEALARLESGERCPVLCLETINVPIRTFDAVQQDLLRLFEAVAYQRGLAGLVLITDLGTWNYQNGELLRQSRRFRQGMPVELFPADPVTWNVYHLYNSEAKEYCAFTIAGLKPRAYSSTPFRILAPFDPQQDSVEPENLAEAERIERLPRRKLLATARSAAGAEGFISELPWIE